MDIKVTINDNPITAVLSENNITATIGENNITATVTPASNAPVFVSTEVGTESAAILYITMDRNLYVYSVPDAGDFTLSFSGGAVACSSVQLFSDSPNIALTLSRSIVYGETGTITYTRGTNGIISEVGGDKAASFTKAVTNNVAELTYPAALANRLFWYDPSDLSTITKDGTDIISRFNDKLGNGNDLVTGSALWTVNTVLYNGISQYLKSAAFTWDQPCVIYAIIKQVTWTNNDYWFNGFATGSPFIIDAVSSPRFRANAGAYSATYNALALDTWCILRIKFNGVLSSMQIDDNAAITGDFGANDMGGITIGANFGGSLPANIQHKDFIGMPNDTNETEIYNWLVTRL